MSKPFPDLDKKRLLLTLLKVMGGRKVVVSFDGSGDSGSIDDVNLLDQEGNLIDLKGAEFEWPCRSSEADPLTNKWRVIYKNTVMPLSDILVQITEDALEEEGLDWYNNEGGFGQFTIDLTQTPPKIELDVNIRITETEHHGFDYTEDDESVTEEDLVAEVEAQDKARKELLDMIKGTK